MHWYSKLSDFKMEEGQNLSTFASGGVLDKKGNLADKSKTGGWTAAAIILGAELSEKTCVIGIASNPVTYLVVSCISQMQMQEYCDCTRKK